MKVGFGTVVYETSYRFHKDFVEAINNQDALDFDVLLLNDDLPYDKLHRLINDIECNVEYVKGIPNSTIQELRIQLIKVAKDRGYDILIFGDFDDIFSKNRVKEYILGFDMQYSFFYNNLYYLESKEKFFSTIPDYIEEIDQIIECNFLGLSNTALNIGKIDFELLDALKNKQTITFDWMLYSLLLIQGHRGKKIDNCETYYRIYEKNTAGESNNTTKDFKKEIEVKIEHYSKLINVDIRYNILLNTYTELRDSFNQHLDFLISNSTNENHYWWGNINKFPCILTKEIKR